LDAASVLSPNRLLNDGGETGVPDKPESSGPESATIVLVHGAWHGAWCWELVLEQLRSAGLRAEAIDLPGHGDDAGPLGDLHADATRLTEVLEETKGPVVLVGHSYGGAVVTEAGLHPSVKHLVYVCALAVDSDETCSTVVLDEAEQMGLSFDGMPDLSNGIKVSGDGVTTIEASVAAAALYNGCSTELIEWAISKLGAQRIDSLQQGPLEVAWREKPSTYVICADDKIVHPGLQRLMAKRCTESVEWESGHSPFLSMPGRLVSLLGDLVLQIDREGR
jgi:pimeloyl-ACP methyl ester carboxylesterase